MFYDSIAYYGGGFGRVNRLDLLKAIGHAILRCNEFHLHEPILKKIEEVALTKKAYFDLHLYYSGLITTYYRERNADTGALRQAISLCEKQIALAPFVIREIVDEQIRNATRVSSWSLPMPSDPRYRDRAQRRRDDPTKAVLPSHVGFTKLSIIREKQGKVQEALDLALTAQEQGWEDYGNKVNLRGWENRIARLRRKVERL